MKKRLITLLNSNLFTTIALIAILIGAFGVRLYKVDNPIADWHSWRQSDTAAVTRIYLDRGIDILRPRYYDISRIQTGLNNPEGLRFVEFPIFNLLHVALVQAFPSVSFNILGRMVSILSAVATSFFLYKIGKEVFANKWIGLGAAFYYAFIPFNIFFTRVILPDPLSVAFSVAALWFFLMYYKNEKVLPLILSGILFALALLAKPHSVFYGLPVIVMLFRKYSTKQMLQNIPLVFTLAIVTIPFMLWRYWITHYGNMVGVPHLAWAFNGDGIRFRPSYWRWIFGERVGRMILGTWGLIPFGVGMLKLNKKAYFLGTLLLGMFLYLAIIATANVRHDYYQTFIIPAIALLLSYGSWEILTSKSFNRQFSLPLLLFVIGMMMLIGIDQVKGFYNINHYEIIEAGNAVNELTPKDAKVVAPYNGDTAFLYQTQRFGWPIVDTNIEDLIERGADYYVSVNYDDQTNKYKDRFETVVENDKFIILDLNKEK